MGTLRRWWFAVVWIASAVLAGGSYDPMPADELAVAYAPVLGLALGCVWQVLYRRDLADRLLAPAALSVVGIVGGIVDPGGATRVGIVMYGVGLVVGLVLAENAMRRRVRAADVAAPGEDPQRETAVQ